MWIKMKSTCEGSAGMFIKGDKYDLPPGVVKLLPKGEYEDICAPWDEHKDEDAARLYSLQGQLEGLRSKAERLANEIEADRRKADKLVAESAQTQAIADEAGITAKKAVDDAQKENATDDDKREALRMARIDEIKDAQDMKVKALLQVQLAEIRLKVLDAGDVQTEIEQVESQIAELTAKAAEKKAKAEAEARPKADAEAKAKEDVESKAKAAAEAKAKKTAAARAELDKKAKAGEKEAADKLLGNITDVADPQPETTDQEKAKDNAGKKQTQKQSADRKPKGPKSAKRQTVSP